ncbi:MAG: substrate-binding periplasmic protein [Terasakiella sp.]|uniref:substrate-binding periplasmic protein n=1 Tax=unclassified Terasakiella TaxID=2614952 RepID=UPI003B00EBAA
MIKGLPKDARCLERVQETLPNASILDMPWKRIIQSLQSGKSDITPCIFKTPERETFLDLYGPIAMLPIILVRRNAQNIHLGNIKNYHGVFLRGTSLIKDYTNKTMRVSETSRIPNILELIRNGRADYSLMPGNFIEDRNITDLNINVIDEIPLYIGISKKSPQKTVIWNQLSDHVPIASRNIPAPNR